MLAGARPLLISKSAYKVGQSFIATKVDCHGQEQNLSNCKRVNIKGSCSYVSGAMCLGIIYSVLNMNIRI